MIVCHLDNYRKATTRSIRAGLCCAKSCSHGFHSKSQNVKLLSKRRREAKDIFIFFLGNETVWWKGEIIWMSCLYQENRVGCIAICHIQECISCQENKNEILYLSTRGLTVTFWEKFARRKHFWFFFSSPTLVFFFFTSACVKLRVQYWYLGNVNRQLFQIKGANPSESVFFFFFFAHQVLEINKIPSSVSVRQDM